VTGGGWSGRPRGRKVPHGGRSTAGYGKMG
jgi:hypothetical protein